MKKVKTLLCLLLPFFLVSLSILTISGFTNNGIYVNTIPNNDVDDYVSSSIYDQIIKHKDIVNPEELSLTISSGIIVNEKDKPKNFTNTYLYPIYINNELKYVYRVFDNGEGGFSSVLSQSLATQLDRLKYITTPENPATIITSNGTLLALINNDTFILEESHDSSTNSCQDINFFKNNKFNIINLQNTNDIIRRSTPVSRAGSYAYISVDYKETQGNNSWCAAYVTAKAIRVMKGKSIYASTIASYYGLSTSQGLSRDRVIAYSKSQGLSPSSFISGKLTVANATLQLVNRKLIYGAYSNSRGNHAILIHGVNGNTFNVSNPWYAYSETYTASSGIYVAASGERWNMTGYINF